MGALIFDFDGVIADSEAIANTVLAETVPSVIQQRSTRRLRAIPAADGTKPWLRSKRRSENRSLGFSNQLKLATLSGFGQI